MNNNQKSELRGIVKSIPEFDEQIISISKLHKRYAYDYEYQTFRKYLLAFRPEFKSIEVRRV